MPEARSKKVPKKSAAAPVAKKPAPRSKVTKKSVAKKPAKAKVSSAVKKAKVTPKKTAVKKAATKPKSTKAQPKSVKAAPRKKTPKTAAKIEKEVVLPTSMSLRAKEKSLVWATEFEKKIHKPAYALTMTFGALFILFGSYSGLHYSNSTNPCVSSQCAAQLAAVEDVSSSHESVPTVELISDIPTEISSDTVVLIDTEHTQSVVAELRFSNNAGSMQTQEISVGNVLNGRFRITIPGSDLTPNQYMLRVQPLDAQGETYGYTTLGSFVVVDPFTRSTSLELSAFDLTNQGEQTESQSQSQSASFSSSESTSSSQTSSTGETTEFSESISTESETVDGITETITTSETSVDGVTQVTEVVEVTESTETVEVADTSEDEEFAQTQSQETDNQIVISVSDIVSARAPVSIQSAKAQIMAVYLRRLQGTEEQLVGRIYGKNVTYYLNTQDFPNGSYELTVRSVSTLDSTESNSMQIDIENETEPIALEQPERTPVIDERRELLEITPIITRDSADNSAAAQSELILQDDNEQSATPTDVAGSPITSADRESLIDQPVKRLALEKLETDTVLLDTLFTRYAAAVQSGNQDMIREARAAITSYQRSIVDQALADDNDRFIADDLSKSLQDELDQIAVKVETFESLRRERSEGEASKDSDNDGITDTDERVLFGTDPLRADTDGDGFTDGAEIIRGFNPVDAASEAVIVYKSPKETIGISANENLKVLQVVPDVALPNALEEEAIVQTTVRGQALPNSFVTLFIFSTPTIVTVKTEADGSFEYTFSKELEDGEHQVFVALTDNTGDIVAQSDPFTFVKQAEAFTAVDAETAITQTETTNISSGISSFQTVLSMSVLALGILLIMLGVGLRSNRPELTVNQAAA